MRYIKLPCPRCKRMAPAVERYTKNIFGRLARYIVFSKQHKCVKEKTA